jgi:hypothetical protein
VKHQRELLVESMREGGGITSIKTFIILTLWPMLLKLRP